MTNQTMQVQELKPKVDITTRPPLPPFTREHADLLAFIEA